MQESNTGCQAYVANTLSCLLSHLAGPFFFFLNFDFRFVFFKSISLALSSNNLARLACKPGGYKLTPPHLVFVRVLRIKVGSSRLTAMCSLIQLSSPDIEVLRAVSTSHFDKAGTHQTGVMVLCGCHTMAQPSYT